MLCAFCGLDKAKFAWDETSHLGKRPICYGCVGKRDLQKMSNNGSAILYFHKGKLTNLVKSLSLPFLKKKNKLLFSLNGEKWQGTIDRMFADRIVCRRI